MRSAPAPRWVWILVCMRGTVGMVAHSSTGVPAGSAKCKVRPWCGTSTKPAAMLARSRCDFALSRSSSVNTRKPMRSHCGWPLVRLSVRLWWQRSSTPRSQIVSVVSSLTIRPSTST